MSVAAVLDHVDGNVVVVDAWSRRVDAGEGGGGAVSATGGIVFKAVLRSHTGARAAVPAVVALKTTEPINRKAQRPDKKFGNGSR